MLASLWHDLCEVDRAEFTLDRKTDFYRWHPKTGSSDTRRWPHPQAWANLVATSNSPAAQDMFLTRDFVPLVMPFSLVYPHRFTSGLAYLAETSA